MNILKSAELYKGADLLLRLSIEGYENPNAVDIDDRMWIRVSCDTDKRRYANGLSMSVMVADLEGLSTFLAEAAGNTRSFFNFVECGLELWISKTSANQLECAASLTGLDDQHFEFCEQVDNCEVVEFKKQLDVMTVSLNESLPAV